jgi:hypothetical protein
LSLFIGCYGFWGLIKRLVKKFYKTENMMAFEKVKLTLEATKAQRGSKGLPLLFF